MLDAVGGVLLTVSTNVLVAVSPPASVTVRVMVEEPIRPTVGARVMVRLAPDPPKEIPEAGSRLVFEEVADTFKEPAAVSWSDTVKASGPAVLPSTID